MIVGALCPCCGAELDVESAEVSAKCPCCGSGFLIEAGVAFLTVRSALSQGELCGDFVVEDGILVRYTGSGGDVRVPAGVRSIGTQAFGGCAGLTSVELPEGLVEGGEGAFARCTSLVRVQFPASIRRLLSDAFARCVSLRCVEFAAGTDQASVNIDEDAFYCCGAIERVEGWQGEFDV